MLKYNEFITERKSEFPFIQAAKSGKRELVEAYLNDGADINQVDNNKRTALMWAALNSKLSIVDLLLKNGANPNLTDKQNRTALMMASTMKIVDKLLDAGINVNIQNNYNGNTAIMEYLNYDWTADQIILLVDKFSKHNLNLDLKNFTNDQNFYEKLLQDLKISNAMHIEESVIKYNKIKDYMDKNFPQYKEKWELKHNVEKYNL